LRFKIKNNAAVEVTVSEKNNLLGSTYGDKATVAAGALVVAAGTNSQH